jgi:hypothetical protein
MSTAWEKKMYHSYGIGEATEQDKTVLWCTIGSAAVSGYLGFKSGGTKTAAIWGGAGAAVPQILHKLHAWALTKEWGAKLPKASTATALVGCSIVPAYAFFESRKSRALGFGGMF